MTLADIKKSVRGLLQDDQFDGDLIREAANWFVYEIFNNTRTRLMESSDTITAAAGDTTMDLPDDFMTRINIYLTAPQIYSINDSEMPYDSFMREYANFATSRPAQVGRWTPYGMGIRFSAPLNADHTFQIDYLREPVPMEQGSDECEVPDRYSELVAKGALARIMEINEDYAEASQERNNLEPQLTVFIRNEARGGGKTGPSIIRTGRGRTGGIRRLGD